MVDVSPERPPVNPEVELKVDAQTDTVIDLRAEPTETGQLHTEAVPIANNGHMDANQLARRDAIIHNADRLFRQRRQGPSLETIMRAKFRELFHLETAEPREQDKH